MDVKSKTARADGLLLATAAIWGFAFVAQRVGMRYVGPFIFNGVRFALAALVLIPFVEARRRKSGRWRGQARAFLRSGLLAGLFLFTASSFQQIGVVYTTAGKAGFITGLYVVIVPLIALFWRHRTGLGTWLGAAMAAAGMYFLSIGGDFSIARGDLLVLISAFFWAGHVLIIGRFSRRIDPIALALAQCSVCSVLSLAVAFATEEITVSGLYSAAVPIIYGGVFSVGVAYTFQILAQRHAPAAHASIIMSFEAVFAVLGGWLMIGETLSARGILGCAMMFAAMLSSQYSVIRERRKKEASG